MRHYDRDPSLTRICGRYLRLVHDLFELVTNPKKLSVVKGTTFYSIGNCIVDVVWQ